MLQTIHQVVGKPLKSMNQMRWAALVLLTTCFYACRRPSLSPAVTVTTSLSEKNTCHLEVEKVTLLVPRGGNVDWSPDGMWIAYDAPNDMGWTDTWLMHPDGSGKRCLTCNDAIAPTPMHMGNPTWHPGGEWLVVQGVEERFFQRFPSTDEAYKQRIMDVGVGIGNELWAVTADGSRFVKLTQGVQENGFAHGILHPHFSHDGRWLAWSQRVKNIRGNPDGEWAIKIAEFVLEDGLPRLERMRTLQPGSGPARLYEVHSFSPDDAMLLFTANADGQAQRGYDIYVIELESEKTARLTQSPIEWDEHAHFSPDGKCIIWMSTMNAGARRKLLKTELWYMSADGSGKSQLTYFNDPASWMYYHSSFGVIPADFSWSPRGDAIVLYLIENQSEQSEYSMPGTILMVNLSQSPVGGATSQP